MGKIKKILEKELVGGTQNTDIYPVTSTKAVYNENNEGLDNILKNLNDKIGNRVDLTSEQTITAAKTFSGGINMDGSRIRNVKEPAELADAANKDYIDSNLQKFSNSLNPILNKISFDRWKGVECLFLGNTGTISSPEFNHIVTILQDIINNRNHYIISIFDTIDGTFFGDCENIYKSGNVIHIEQIKMSASSIIYKILYNFNTETNEYSRTVSSIDIQNKLTAGDNIIIEENTISAIVTKLSVNTIWSKLKALRDAESLVPGTWYRITDYTCTTAQDGTRSAGNLFDVIVRADSENKLNEEAFAIQSERDTDGYFANSKLSAWRLWYCLDNDTTRFAWADATDGKGVIYRMIDEWNNDVPYDFKNIQFKRYKITECAKCSTLVGKYTYREDSKYVIDRSQDIWAYTFTHINDSEDILDHSIVGATIPNSSGYCVGVYNNKISSVSSYFYLGSDKPTQFQYRLNNICFISDSNVSKGFSYGCYSNTFKSNCYSMTFGTSCNSNIFGEYCYENTFGDAIWFQTIGKECHNNIFGNGHKYNTIGDSSSNNIFGTNYKYNTLGYNCYNNEFGRDYFHNSFGNSNHGLKLGSYYSHNSFGNSNYELKFGDYLSSNVFLNNCSDIVFGSGKSDTAVIYSHYSNNFFGNNCWSLVLKETTTSSTDIQNYNFASGLQSKTIDLERGRSYETKVAKNSNGELKIYCEADLIQ